jgi:hypothetical protein
MSMIMVNGVIRTLDGTAAPPRYVEVKSPSESIDLELEDVLDAALAEWGLGRGIGIKWFAAAADCPAAWRVPGGESFADIAGLKGRIDCLSPRTIWLRRGLEREQRGDAMWWVACHEVEHTRQELRGECRGSSAAELERKANAYADSLVPEYRRGRAA